MSGSDDHNRIPEPVPALSLPEFEYEDLEKIERIGMGGDADVYRATIDHNGYRYPVAVKEPRIEGTIQKRAVEKFQTEAETWSSLDDHDNIVSVYRWGTGRLPWLVLEFMDGGTLESKIGSVDIAEALWLAGRIAEGIRFGHRHGIAHLDIKPTNVLLRNTPAGKWDYPKVSDWGLAKMLLKHSNSIEGISPTYAAPEQFDADTYGTPDDITDIYQLGAVVYALVAGEPPFSGSSTAVMRGVLQKNPDPPSEVNSKVPAAVDEIVLKALAKKKSNRYEGILLFRRDLDRVFDDYIADDERRSSPITNSTTDERRDQTTGRGTNQDDTTAAEETGTLDPADQKQSASADTRNKNQSSQYSIQKNSGEGGSTVSRRTALWVLSISAVGVGGGWAANQMGGSDAGSVTPSSSGTPTKTTIANQSQQTDGGRFSFEQTDATDNQLPSPWSVISDPTQDGFNSIEISEQHPTHGTQTLHMSGNGQLDRILVGFVADLSNVETVQCDIFIKRANNSFGEIYFGKWDGESTKILKFLGATGGEDESRFTATGQFTDIEGDISELSGENEILFNVRGDNEAYFDNLRFFDRDNNLTSPIS